MASDFVLGIDSSTQSTKALLVDAATATSSTSRSAPHPDGTEVDPRAWLEAVRPGHRRPARAGRPRSRSAASSTAWSPSTTTATAVRDALLWNDTRSAARRATSSPRWAAQALRRRHRQRARRLVHVDQAALAARPRARAAARTASVLLPHDYVSRHLGDRRPSRSPTAATPPAPATSPPARATGCPTSPRPRSATTSSSPASSRPPRSPARPPPARVVGRRHRRQHGRRPRPRPRPGDVLVSIGTSGVGLGDQRRPGRRRHRLGDRLRRRHRRASCRW